MSMNDPQLDSGMRNLAAHVAAIDPPGEIEAAVMAEFGPRPSPPGRRARSCCAAHLRHPFWPVCCW